MAIFLDTNVVIYLIEWTPQFGRLAANRIESLLLQGERLVVSDLVRMECRVRPLRMNDATTLAAFDAYFASAEVDVAPVTPSVCDRAAAIRAAHNLRPMDSLHLAAALEHGCQRFLTHDMRLAAFSQINIDVLS
jgi:predicted nucleic acid-binding protein